MTLGERIKKARKALDLTQQKFAEQIGTTQNNIASYEIGRREPSAAAINNICKTFNISETWLRTGNGEMFVQRSEDDELAAVVERLITGESAEFKRRLINALSTLKDEHWVILEEKLREIVGTRDAGSGSPAFSPAPEDRARCEEPADSGPRPMIKAAARSGGIIEIEEIHLDELPVDDDPIP